MRARGQAAGRFQIARFRQGAQRTWRRLLAYKVRPARLGICLGRLEVRGPRHPSRVIYTGRCQNPDPRRPQSPSAKNASPRPSPALRSRRGCPIPRRAPPRAHIPSWSSSRRSTTGVRDSAPDRFIDPKGPAPLGQPLGGRGRSRPLHSSPRLDISGRNWLKRRPGGGGGSSCFRSGSSRLAIRLLRRRPGPMI